MTMLLSAAQAAQIVGTTPFHVIQLCRTGQLPSDDIDGVTVIPEPAVREYAKRSGSAVRAPG